MSIKTMIAVIVEDLADRVSEAENPSNGTMGLGEVKIGEDNYQIQIRVISEEDKESWVEPEEIIVTEVKK